MDALLYYDQVDPPDVHEQEGGGLARGGGRRGERQHAPTTAMYTHTCTSRARLIQSPTNVEPGLLVAAMVGLTRVRR